MTQAHDTTTQTPPLTVEDLDQIAEGIEEFIIGSVDPDPEIVAMWHPYVDQLKAHRALIVAAPKMLEALRRAERYFGDFCDQGVLDQHPAFIEWENVRAAIAKAEGRS